MRITNQQIYDELVDFRGETRKQLDELNGRLRNAEKGLGIALDRTKRIGEEVNHHVGEKDAHGGAAAKATADSEVVAAQILGGSKIQAAVLGLGGGIVGGLIAFLGQLLTR